MTEKKPGEPDEADHVFIEKILGIREYFFASLLATYREEIESRAKREFGLLQKLRDIQEKEAVTKARREGAREALERAAAIARDKARAFPFDGPEMAGVIERAIRALADQPEAEGEQAPGVADLALMRGEAPAKADALPRKRTRCPHGYALDDDCLDCDGGPTPLGQYRGERPWRKPE